MEGQVKTPGQKIVDIAHAEIGTKESPAGSNKQKYGEWYPLNGQPWCAMFVSWVYAHAGYPLGHIEDANGYRSCQGGYDVWKAKKMLTTAPQEGDIVLYDWKNDNHKDHTGIFVKWLVPGKTFQSIEGNTAIGNDSNGGEVMLRERSVNTATFVHIPLV